MKVLYSCLSKSWGGMEMVTLTGISQLLKHNIKVELLCSEDSRLQLEANNLGIIIHPVRTGKTPTPGSILKLSSLIKNNNYDLIHSHASKDLWLIVPALKFSKNKIPLVFTKHIGSYINKKDFLHNWLYNRVNVGVAISTVIKNNLIETTSLTEEKVRIIFNGVDLHRFDEVKTDRKKVRNELKINDDELLIGMTARFSPGKGHEEFLFAADKLSKKYSHLKFVVVGEASRGEDDYAQKIKQLAESYSLNNVYFLGFRSDIPDVLAAMDIFVFPSHAEAFGIALIEAMAMSKPSVCANADGVLDITLESETSYLFKVKDGNELSLMIEKLIRDSAIRKIFGDNSRKRVREIFNIEKITDQTIKLYNELIESIK